MGGVSLYFPLRLVRNYSSWGVICVSDRLDVHLNGHFTRQAAGRCRYGGTFRRRTFTASDFTRGFYARGYLLVCCLGGSVLSCRFTFSFVFVFGMGHFSFTDGVCVERSLGRFGDGVRLFVPRGSAYGSFVFREFVFGVSVCVVPP